MVRGDIDYPVGFPAVQADPGPGVIVEDEIEQGIGVAVDQDPFPPVVPGPAPQIDLGALGQATVFQAVFSWAGPMMAPARTATSPGWTSSPIRRT